MKILLAKVKKQRDNGPDKPNVQGQWVGKNGFSDDVRDAQIFTDDAAIRSRLPRLWEFEIIPFESAFVPGYTVSKD